MNGQGTTKVSIIVPVYKVEKYLDRCVKSIVNQTYKNLEIILVDDGSPDNCPSMCDRWGQLDKRVKVIHQKNKGVSGARNAALDICTGEYVLFVDSDDWIASELCEKVLDKIKDTGADVVVFGYKRSLAGMGKTISERIIHGESRMINRKEAISMLVNDEQGFEVCTRIYRRNLFLDIRFPEGKYYEDVPVAYQIMQKADKIYIWNRPFYYYEKRCNSTTGTENYVRMNDLLENEIWSKKFVLQHYPELEEAYKRRLGRVAYMMCSVAGRGAVTKKAALILRSQKMCIAGKEAHLFLKHECLFWLLVNLRRRIKDTELGKLIWKIKWRVIFELKGESRK